MFSGYPFRGKIIDAADGDTLVVQMRNVGAESGVSWGDVVCTKLPGRNPAVWLQDGDIVFAARGKRNYAVVVQGCAGRVTISPHFFQIRVKDKEKILPKFLAWQINQAPAQKYFKQSAEGSAVIGIRKSVLAKLHIEVPSLVKQKKIIELIKCWNKEKASIDSLAGNHNKLMAVIAKRILNNSSYSERKSE